MEAGGAERPIGTPTMGEIWLMSEQALRSLDHCGPVRPVRGGFSCPPLVALSPPRGAVLLSAILVAFYQVAGGVVWGKQKQHGPSASEPAPNSGLSGPADEVPQHSNATARGLPSPLPSSAGIPGTRRKTCTPSQLGRHGRQKPHFQLALHIAGLCFPHLRSRAEGAGCGGVGSGGYGICGVTHWVPRS